MTYVYVLKSLIKGEYYIGSTIDLKRRLRDHNKGLEISTRRYLPWELVYYEAYPIDKFARLRESRLKHHGNAKKELFKRIGLSPVNKEKGGAGFTIVELIISISIFMFLTTVTILSFRGAGFANSVRSNGAIVSGALRRMQSYAVSGNSIKVCSDYATTPRTCAAGCGLATCIDLVPTGGYGVVVLGANATSVSLFADLNNDQQYTVARDILVDNQTVALTDRTFIANAGTFPQSVVFGAQRGKPSFIPVGGNAGSSVQYFCLRHPNFTGNYRKVIVNGITGLIDDSTTSTCP